MFSQKTNRQSKGFTLIELLVVIAIIGILSGVVLVSLNSARARARDAKRISDLRQLQTALELYYLDNGSYPSTTVVGSSIMANGDPGCGGGTTNWIPNLAPKYIAELPKDPRPGKTPTGGNSTTSCYLYASDGKQFVLSAWGSVEGGPQKSTLYTRVGFRETSTTYKLYADLNATYPQYIINNNANIGACTSQNPDHYQYSYTITNIVQSTTSGCNP